MKLILITGLFLAVTVGSGNAQTSMNNGGPGSGTPGLSSSAHVAGPALGKSTKKKCSHEDHCPDLTDRLLWSCRSQMKYLGKCRKLAERPTGLHQIFRDSLPASTGPFVTGIKSREEDQED